MGWLAGCTKYELGLENMTMVWNYLLIVVVEMGNGKCEHEDEVESRESETTSSTMAVCSVLL